MRPQLVATGSASRESHTRRTIPVVREAGQVASRRWTPTSSSWAGAGATHARAGRGRVSTRADAGLATSGPVVAVLGGGQLGRMLGLAGLPLGLDFRFLDPSPQATAQAVGALRVAALDDEAAAAELAAGARVVTWEWEGIPAATARAAAAHAPVRPDPRALEVAQDRLLEKETFARIGLTVPKFATVDDRVGLDAAVDQVGLPAVLKTRRGGYDGKGQHVLREAAELDGAWAALGGAPSILEELIPFQRELSVVAVRGITGETACYPLVETVHAGGVLRSCQRAGAVGRRRLPGAGPRRGVAAPRRARLRGGARHRAVRLRRVAGHQRVRAPGAQLRALDPRGGGDEPVREPPAGRARLAARSDHGAWARRDGERARRAPDRDAILAVEGASFHDYRKAPHPGRKVGHVTVIADTAQGRDHRLDEVQAIVDATTA